VGSGHQEGVKIQEKEHGTGVFFRGKNILKGEKLKMETPRPRVYSLESFTET